MEFKCKDCGARNAYDENKYSNGESVDLPCRRCGTFNTIIVNRSDDESGLDSDSVLGRDDSASNENDKVVESTVSEQKDVPPLYNPLSSSKLYNDDRQIESAATPHIESSIPEKKGNSWIVVVVLLLLLCGAGGWWYYDNIYIPEKIDREAPRTYPIVNLNLRSSKMSGSDYNKLTSVPYGGELITYSMDGEWAEVKYVKPDGSEATKGYAAAPYLVDKKDFYLLNSIFGDNDAREILATSKVRRALLDYYKEKGYVGRLSSELMNEVGLSAGSDSQWQVFFPHGDKKPNEVVFKRLVRSDSKFTDMALIIKNINTGDRKLLYFYFDDDETPHFLGEMDAPREGKLKDVVNTYGDITPVFGD